MDRLKRGVALEDLSGLSNWRDVRYFPKSAWTSSGRYPDDAFL